MPEIRLQREGAVARLVIDHPERRNALTPEMMGHLASGLDAIAADRDIRAVILTGAGERAFASGGDISRMNETRRDYAATKDAADRRSATFAKIAGLDRPVIAMIRGYCMGGGMALALQADLRFAAEDAVFAIPAARLGIAYGPEGIAKLMALVGPSATRDILFSGRRLDAAEALSLGLVNRVLPAAELEAATLAYCADLARNAPLSMASAKLIVGELLKPSAERDWDAIEAAQRTAAESEDIREGRAAFLEKREPRFRGV